MSKPSGNSTATHAPHAMLLAASGQASVAVSSVSAQDGGPRRRRYRKDLVRVGQFFKAADDLAFSITADTLNHWSQTYRDMRAAGRKVPVVKTHFSEHGAAFSEDDADANRGWLEDLFVDGDRLVGIVDLHGPEAETLAACNDVSIYVPTQYEDDQRRVFKQPIMHIALTAKPVISGLGPFVEIAASASSKTKNPQGKTPAVERVPVLVLQQETSSMDQNTPALPAAAASQSPKDAIREAIKSQVVAVMDDDSIDDAAAFKRIKDLFKARAKAMGVLDTMDEKPEEKPAEGGDAGAAVAASAAKTPPPATPDPLLVQLGSKSRKQDLAALLTSGRISKAQHDKLAAKAGTLAFSQAGIREWDDPIELLQQNTPLAGERTGAQTLSLSGSAAAPDADAARFREQTAANVARMTGLKATK